MYIHNIFIHERVEGGESCDENAKNENVYSVVDYLKI